MSYATQDDLVPLRLRLRDLVDLTDDTESESDAGAGQVNAAIVTAALAEASARVDSYCRQRYVTPLAWSDSVKSVTLDIALYLLFTRRRDTKPSETVTQRYEAAIGFLKDIAAGRASLDQPVLAAGPQGASGGPVVTAIPQRFSGDGLDPCSDPLRGWA